MALCRGKDAASVQTCTQFGGNAGPFSLLYKIKLSNSFVFL